MIRWAVGADIYAGSFTLGVQWAGFNILGHVEHPPFYGAKTAMLNFPDLKVYDIEQFPTWREWTPWARNKKVDLVYSNPPCSPFSSARKPTLTRAKNEAWKDDPRTEHVWDDVQLAVELGAKTYVWESITHAWTRGNAFVMDIARCLADYNYAITIVLQNNMYIGSTQNRKRMFLVAHRYPLILPPLTFDPLTTDQLLEDIKTELYELRWLEDAREELWTESIRFQGSFARAQKHLDETVGIDERIGKQSFLDYRLLGHVPPRVFMSDTTRTHPHEPRYFTWSEMKKLCGLPEEWQSAETNMQKRALELSRAVLPHAGMWIATAVQNGLNHRRLTTPTYTLIDMLDPYHVTHTKLEL